jgi:hypothetical protein
MLNAQTRLLLICALAFVGWQCRTALETLPGGSAPGPKAIVFLYADCPISQKYTLKINQLAQKYPQVRFFGVFPQGDSEAAVRQFGEAYATQFPLRRDARNRLVRRLGASITPEVFLLDGQNKTRYAGAIDNWYFALGQYRPAPTEHYLEAAIEDLLARRPVARPRTRAIGCAIEPE